MTQPHRNSPATQRSRPHLTIGEFARASGLTVKALRNYHERGLLVPDQTDDGSGYRLYHPGQLVDAATIRLLRDLDVPLADIAQVLDARDPEVTARVLRQRQESLAAQIADAERVLQQLRQVSLAPEAGTPVRVVELPHRHALAVRAEIELEQCPEFFGEAFPRLAAAAGRFGAEVAGPSGATYPVQATDGPQTVTAFLPVRSPVQPGDGVVLVDLPRATAGLLTHRGGYDTIDNPYLQLGAWVGYHARSSGLPVEEHYVVSYGDVEEPADFRTDIHWPIVGHLTEEKK